VTAPSVVVAIQARTGSTRLPGKVLAKMAARPMLRLQLDRLAAVACGPVIVATSTEPGDDAVADLAAAAGIDVVRGSEADVLGRFAAVIERYRPDVLVRLTGDCPLSDPQIVDHLVREHLREDADYTSNLFPRSYPKGLCVEVVRAAALVEAAAVASGPGEREHVTPYLYRRPERFRMANVLSGLDLGQEWWVVDTPADLVAVGAIVDTLPDPVGAGWLDVLERAGTHAGAVAGGVHLKVAGSSPTGACPWVRTWNAIRDGVRLGQVEVAVGRGQVHRRTSKLAPGIGRGDEALILDALDRLLTHDEQVRS